MLRVFTPWKSFLLRPVKNHKFMKTGPNLQWGWGIWVDALPLRGLVRSIFVFALVVFSLNSAKANEADLYDLCIHGNVLKTAMDELHEQTDIQIIYPYDLADQAGVNPVCGRYSADQALKTMLQNTDFSGGLTESGVIVISLQKKQENTVKKETKSLGALLSALVFGVGAQTGLAQDNTSRSGIEEIVVTATKRSATIQDVPFSINAQSQRDIERTGATNIEELSRNVAGLAIQNLGPGQSQVSIRGVSAGQIVRDQPGVKEQVGVYLDESAISLSLFTPDLDLYDLNRVETLRGPQGTLFGSGSVGGTIRYITNAPDLTAQEGSFELNLNSISDGDTGGHIKGMYNVPFEGGAMRAVVYHTEYAGWIDAQGPAAGSDVNSGTRTGGRFSVTFEPNDNLSITPRLIVQNVEADGNNRQEVFNWLAASSNVALGERQQYLLQREGFEDDTTIADLTIEAVVGGMDLTSVTSFTDRDILVSRDASALTHSVSVDVGLVDPAAIAIPSNLLDATAVEQVTQEIRLSSAGDEDFDWLVGVFYSDTKREYAQRLPTPGYDAALDPLLPGIIGVPGITSADIANGFPVDSPFNSDLPYDLEQLAFFGEVNYAISDRLDLTLGGRFYDYEESRTITSGGFFANGDTGVVDNTESDGFNPRILLKYAASETVTWNAQISEGFRLGGVNDPLNASLCQGSDIETFGSFQNYGDESLTNYEIGFKGDYETFSVNAAVFYADMKDLQVTLDAGSCSSRISFNVPDAHSAGFEFEMKAQPTEYLDFSIAASVVEAEFDSTVVDGSGNVLGGIQDGNRLASVPEFSAAASATYTVPFDTGDAYFSATFQHVGDRITQPGDQVAGAGTFAHGLAFGALDGSEVTTLDLNLPSYEILNLNAGYETEDWTAVVYLTNALDENALQSFDRERGGRARLAHRVVQPRTLGITYRRNF